MLLKTYSFQEIAVVCVCKIIFMRNSQLDLEICIGFSPQPGAEHPHSCPLTASSSGMGKNTKSKNEKTLNS